MFARCRAILVSYEGKKGSPAKGSVFSRIGSGGNQNQGAGTRWVPVANFVIGKGRESGRGRTAVNLDLGGAVFGFDRTPSA